MIQKHGYIPFRTQLGCRISQETSIEAFNKQNACLFQGIVYFFSLDIFVLFFSIPFLMNESFKFFLRPNIRRNTWKYLEKGIPVISVLEFLAKGRQKIYFFRCLNYTTNKCIFYENQNTLLRRNLSLNMDQAGRSAVISY